MSLDSTYEGKAPLRKKIYEKNKGMQTVAQLYIWYHPFICFSRSVSVDVMNRILLWGWANLGSRDQTEKIILHSVET